MSMQAIHSGVGATVKGVDKVARFWRRGHADAEKSQNTAIRVEGYRLKKLLQRQIRQGAPGGKSFVPLSYIARRLHGRRPNRKPLERLALGVRYHVVHNPFAMAIGWVGPQTGFDATLMREKDPFGRGISRDHVSSKSWRRLAWFHQRGFEREITPFQRYHIIYRGGKLGKIEGGSTPFFLKKQTKSFKTPARKIIEPFWQSERGSVYRNIKRNFRLKLKGKRI